MLIPEWLYWTSTFSSIAIELTSRIFSKVTGKTLHGWLTVGVAGKSIGHFLDLVRSRSN